MRPVIAILLAAADFERTVRRAIRGLSEIQPSEVKNKIERDYGSFKKHPDAWKKYAIGHKELFIKTTKRTPSYSDSDVILPNYEDIERAFDLRNELVHGSHGTTGIDYASERVRTLLDATRSVTEYAHENGVDLMKPIRSS